MLSGRSSLYVTNPRTFIILKNFSLAKSSLLLGLVVWINIIFVFSVFCRRYTLFFFLKVSSQTLFLFANFFMTWLKNIKSCRSSFYSLWILFTITTKYSTNSSHSFISNKISASNSLFIKNAVLLVILHLEVLYAVIPMGNNLTQLVCW